MWLQSQGSEINVASFYTKLEIIIIKKRIFVFFRGQGIFTFMFCLTRKVLDIVKELRLFIFSGAKRFAGSNTSGMDFFGRAWLVKQREPDSARIHL